MEFKPPFIDVTTSREEYIFIEKANGLLERKVTRMRPGTLGICAAIQHKYNVDTVPHVLCGGFTKEETLKTLQDYEMGDFKDVVKNNYDGYKFFDKEMFCPWDVVNFIKENYKNKGYIYKNESFVFINEGFVYKNRTCVYRLIPIRKKFNPYPREV